mgnify:CR=1 FL=1
MAKESISRSSKTILGALGEWLKEVFKGSKSPGLESIVNEIEEDISLTPSQRRMLVNLLAFGSVDVEDVMVPRADIIAVDSNNSLTQVIALFRKAGHSRMPIYKSSLDEIIGMVHVKDLLSYWQKRKNFKLTDVSRKLLFVPPSMLVSDLLGQMRVTRIHMAIVVDEHGGTDGLVSIEDLVEEIVGEIEDEHDSVEEPMILALADGTFEVDARALVTELEHTLGIELIAGKTEETIESIGGLIFTIAGRVPKVGEKICYESKSLTFEIIRADPRRILKIRVSRSGVKI